MNEEKDLNQQEEETVQPPLTEEQPELKEAESPLEKLNAELSESKDKYVRLYAEFDNFRRRTAKEKLDLIQTAGEGVIKDLIPVLDDLERALNTMTQSEQAAPFKDGIELIRQKFLNTLTSKGLKTMDAKGKPFDSDWHEAITQIPAPEEALKGCVVDEVEKGYLLGEKVIRYAKVVIGA
jgi:molecular chaperone GrpE